DAAICAGQSYQWHGQIYTQAGSYNAVYASVNGCDSIYYLNLEVYPKYEFVEDVSICDDSTYQWQGNTYTESGTYFANYTTVNGCDSIYILNLIVFPSYEFVENASICDGQTYQWHGQVYTQSGTYYANYTTINGCDSIYVLNLIVNPSYEDVENVSICGGNTYMWQGQSYYQTGTYTVNYTTVDGCDSIFTLHLTVNPIDWFVEDVTICDGTIYQWQGQVYTTAGEYIANYTNSNGCDSTYILHLYTIASPMTYLISEVGTHCGGSDGELYIDAFDGAEPYTFMWSNGSTTQNIDGLTPGTYTVTVTGANNCKAVGSYSVHVIAPAPLEICIVTVDTNTDRNMVVWEKEPSSILSHYNIWRQTTTLGVYELAGSVPYTNMSTWIDMQSDPEQRAWKYKVSVVDTCGIESTMSEPHKTIHLTMSLGLGNDVNLNWNHYEGIDFLTYYIHRFDWNNGWVVIDSISSDMDSYTDTPTGINVASYKIAIKKDIPCVASGSLNKNIEYYSEAFSNSVEFSNVGNEEIGNLSEMIIFPNPFREKTTITFPNPGNTTYRLDVYNVAGQLVKTIDNINDGFIELDRDYLSTGFYMIELTGEEVFRGKIIVN
ncbi:MAG: T9SS type A sorting domain-containing protein, partial [Bacteroidales bacterium]|nr:T9SS type A sorting domain-containing protein [Bacteroidales bacterium]